MCDDLQCEERSPIRSVRVHAELPLAVSPGCELLAGIAVEGLEAQVSEKLVDEIAGIACAVSDG